MERDKKLFIPLNIGDIMNDEIEFNGYDVTKNDIETLPDGSDVKISFLIGGMPNWGTKKFGRLSYFNSRLEQLIGKVSAEEGIRKYHEHDCGDPSCPGIGETYILKSDKLKIIAKELT